MIPKDKVSKQDVLDAIFEIDQKGVPEGRRAKGFDLFYNGKAYPPKYVISLATKHATGHELPPHEFSGGEAINSFLTGLGFEVRAKPQQPIRDALENVLRHYLMARDETFSKEHMMWKVFRELRESLRRTDPTIQSSSCPQQLE